MPVPFSLNNSHRVLNVLFQPSSQPSVDSDTTVLLLSRAAAQLAVRSLGFCIILLNRHKVHVEEIQRKPEKNLYLFLLSHFNSSRR